MILRSTFDNPASGSDLFSNPDFLSLFPGTAILLNFKTSPIYYLKVSDYSSSGNIFYHSPENKSMKRQNAIPV